MPDSTKQDSKDRLPRRPFAARDRFWGVVSLLYLLVLVLFALLYRTQRRLLYFPGSAAPGEAT